MCVCVCVCVFVCVCICMSVAIWAQVSSRLTHFHSRRFATTMSTIPADVHGFLNPNDHVAISFWIVSIAMVVDI